MQNPILFALRHVNIQFDKTANHILKPYDMSISQFKVLAYLYRHPPFTVRQVDIEKFYYITNPTVTGILHTLEKKGLIKRKINPDDERSKVIALTEKAYDMREDMMAIGSQFEHVLTDCLDENEKEQLRNILTKILDNTANQ